MSKYSSKPNFGRKKYKINTKRIWALVLILAIVIVGGYFIYQNTGNVNLSDEQLMNEATFIDGINVNGIGIGGLKYDEAFDKLTPTSKEMIEDFNLKIELNDKTYSISEADININTDLEGILKEAIKLGQNGSRGERKKAINEVKKNGKNYKLAYTYEEELLESRLNSIENQSGNAAKNASVKMENGSLVYVEGHQGISIKRDEFKKDFNDAIAAGENNITIKAQTTTVNPSITVDMLKQTLVKKSSTTTEFKSSDSSRVKNVVKAADMLNGQMILPGNTLSVNSVLGARTLDNGWSVATGISGGKYIDDVGGGVCQVSSTLYNSAVESGLEITQRSHHTFPVAYLPIGQDAAISTGGPDLKIKNNYDFPVYIVSTASSSSKTLTIMVYGPKNEDGTSIKFRSKEISNTDPKDKAKITINENLMTGEYVEIKPRKNRIEVERWIEYIKDGKVIKTEKFANDVYSAFTGEYAIGKDTPIDEKTGKPIGKKVDQKYLTQKRETTQATTTTQTTQQTTAPTSETVVE